VNKSSLQKSELAPFVKKAKTLTLVIIFVIFVMLFLPWEQTTKGEGKLIAYEPSERDYKILAPISGFIKNYNIEENKYIKKGSLLFEMVDLDTEYLGKLKDIKNDIQTQYTNAQSSIKILHQKKDNLQENLETGLQIHDEKINQINDTLQTLKNKLLSQKNNYRIATSNYERIQLLYNDGIESKRSFELAHNDYIKSGNTLDNILVNIKKEKKSLKIQKKEKESFLKTQENKINTMQNALLNHQNSMKNFSKEMKTASINLSRNSTAKVYASKDGYPLRALKNDEDHYVKQGEEIIHFAPKVTKRGLLLKVRALDMPLIKEGLKVRIQFYGWPSLQVSGWPKITFGTFGGIVDKIDSIAHEEDSFYAYIVEDPNELWPDSNIMKVGTKATAWVRLSTVSIWYEMWRLHNALPLKMVR